MRVRVTKCFTDRTLLGKHGSSRRPGDEFECDDKRAAELAELGLVETLEPAKPRRTRTKKTE